MRGAYDVLFMSRDAGPDGVRSRRTRWSGPESPFERIFRPRRSSERSGIKVRGADVTYALTIDVLEAARDVTRRVSMAGGRRLDVRLPPATVDSQTLRLKGQDMARPGARRGEPYMTLKVVLPDKPDRELTECVRRWASAGGDAAPRKSAVAV